MTPQQLIDEKGKVGGVYCVRACIGYVSGHIRGTRGKTASFVHPNGKTYAVYHCLSCGAYWKKQSAVEGEARFV